MIKIAHFQADRGDSKIVPKWPEAEKLLNQIPEAKQNIVSITAYPSALHHNLIVVYDDGEIRV